MTTRPAALGDIPHLVEMMGEFYAESRYDLDAVWAAKSFSALLAGDRGAAWIAFRESQPAGYVVLTLKHSMETGGLDGFVDDFFVRPPYRRQGVGGTLLDALLRAGIDRELRALHVEVDSANVPAQSVYRALGMRPNGRQLLSVSPISWLGGRKSR